MEIQPRLLPEDPVRSWTLINTINRFGWRFYWDAYSTLLTSNFTSETKSVCWLILGSSFATEDRCDFVPVSFFYYKGLPFPTEYHLFSFCFLLSFFQILSTRFVEHYLTNLGYVSLVIERCLFFTRFWNSVCCHFRFLTLWRIIMPMQKWHFCACLRCSLIKIHIPVYQMIDHC